MLLPRAALKKARTLCSRISGKPIMEASTTPKKHTPKFAQIAAPSEKGGGSPDKPDASPAGAICFDSTAYTGRAKTAIKLIMGTHEPPIVPERMSSKKERPIVAARIKRPTEEPWHAH